MNLQEATQQVTQGRDLTAAEIGDVMRLIMGGEATPAQIGAILTALHMKGETVEELTGAAIVMREFAAKVSVKADPSRIRSGRAVTARVFLMCRPPPRWWPVRPER